MNLEVSKMLEQVMNTKKEAELANVMDASVKNGIQCGALREYYLESIHKSENQIQNATWCTAYLVSSIVSSENFTKAFKDKTDLAQALNYSKSTISKMLGVVELKEVLFDKGYVGQYTVGQLSELLPEYRDCQKKELDIIPVLDFMHFNDTMTSKEVRDGIKAYKHSLVSEKIEEPATEEEQTTEEESVTEEPATEEPVQETEDQKVDKAVDAFCKQIESINVTFKPKSMKKTILQINAEEIPGLMKYLISRGLITV